MGRKKKDVAELAPAPAPALAQGPVKPFLKWVGGKTQIIENVMELFPREIENYYEPFLGGGSVLLALLSYVRDGRIKVNGSICAADVNKSLINLYKNIQTNLEKFLVELSTIVQEYNSITGSIVNRKAATRTDALSSQESYYYWIRKRFNELEDKTGPDASAMVLFMNKTCFRGVYREGPHGFNVPFGNNKNPGIYDEAYLRSISDLIKDVVFKVASFEETLANIAPGDFVYMDPPYAPIDAKSFVSYTADGFTIEKHKELFGLCETKKDMRFLMSNADVELVREAFPETAYTLVSISCRRAINRKNPGARATEVLITRR